MAINTKEKYIFTDILNKGIKKGYVPGKTKEAIDWFRQTARRTRDVSRADLLAERSQVRTGPKPGSMYMFAYDAKTKDKLPYWDAFPVIFMVGSAKTGFYGINLHYLPPALRAAAMDELYEDVTDPTLSNRARIKVQNIADSRFFKPCLKQYLPSQMRSNLILISPDTWDIALWLPTEQFQKASNQKVWADSTRKIS